MYTCVHPQVEESAIGGEGGTVCAQGQGEADSRRRHLPELHLLVAKRSDGGGEEPSAIARSLKRPTPVHAPDTAERGNVAPFQTLCRANGEQTTAHENRESPEAQPPAGGRASDRRRQYPNC
ncbi:MAG: hypothetical protein C4335_12340 [Armatimonadota bacterium]